jgi:hypothetical protein
MKVSPGVAKRWLDAEDSAGREGRLERLRWMEALMPDIDWLVFESGPISKYLFEEARYCFAYGQFLASIVLGLSFIEISLAGAFYGMGRNDLERASAAGLSKEALDQGWITPSDFDAIERARRFRNPVTHFRRPGHGERVEARAFYDRALPYEVIEGDARHVMETLFRLMIKIVPWATNKEPPIA